MPVDVTKNVSVELVSGTAAVPLDLSEFVWPLYMGSTVRPMKFMAGAQRLAEFKALGQGPVTIQATGPIRPGNDKSVVGVAIAGVLVQSIESLSDRKIAVQLCDRRVELSERVCACDINVRVGPDDYQDETTATGAVCTVEDGLKVIDKAHGTAFVGLASGSVGKDFFLPDDMLLAGRMTLGQALDMVLAAGQMALTVGIDGAYRIVDTAGTFNLDPAGYGWKIAPQGPKDTKSIPAAPKEIQVPYTRRREFTVRNTDYSGTDSDPLPLAQRIQLEQVFAFDGRFLTITELVAQFQSEHGIRSGGNPATVLESYAMSPTWAGTQFQTQPYGTGIAEQLAAIRARDYVAVVKRDFRRLFRLVRNAGADELFALYSNIQFGVMNKAGQIVTYDDDPRRVSPRGTVRCAYAVFSEYPLNALSFLNGLDTATAQVFSLREAPFNVRWERTPSERVLRLEYAIPGGQFAIPGTLDRIPGVSIATAADLTGANPTAGGVNLQKLIVDNDASFDIGYDLEVSMVADQERPNTIERFAIVTKPGIQSGGREYHNLGVDLSVAYCETIDGVNINNEQVDDNANSRVDDYLQQYAPTEGGYALAHSLKLLRDLQFPQRNISELALEFCTVGRPFIGTRVVWGRPTNVSRSAGFPAASRRATLGAVRDVAGQRKVSA